MISVFLLCGCAPEGEPELVINDDYSINSNNNSRVRPPKPSVPPKDPVRIAQNVPWDWIPPAHLEKKRRWTAIILHHSATETGNAGLFDKEHKEKGWDGVGYPFVIGNGTDSGDGQVEVTFRWREQRTGAHCKTPNNWANEEGIGICLVGDFDRVRPTARQMWSLKKLVQFLQNRYKIPQSRIYGHQDTPGAHVTGCPGRHFSVWRFKSMR
ncbi:MAG: peptidoglycan recognition protein family protein [Planctomycetota bacterium]